MDFTILQTLRSVEDEQKMVAAGKSQTMKSKHLPGPDGKARAADCAPFPIDWKDIERFSKLNDLIQCAATELGMKVTWGGTWKTLKDFDLELVDSESVETHDENKEKGTDLSPTIVTSSSTVLGFVSGNEQNLYNVFYYLGCTLVATFAMVPTSHDGGTVPGRIWNVLVEVGTFGKMIAGCP
jgi:hypothetical protein